MKKILRMAIVLIPTIVIVTLLTHNIYVVKTNDHKTYPTHVQCFQTVVEDPQCDGPRAVVFNPKTKSASVVKGTCGNEVATLTIALGWDSFTGMHKNNVIHRVKIDMRADANTKFHITVDKDMQKMVLTPTPQAG